MASRKPGGGVSRVSRIYIHYRIARWSQREQPRYDLRIACCILPNLAETQCTNTIRNYFTPFRSKQTLRLIAVRTTNTRTKSLDRLQTRNNTKQWASSFKSALTDEPKMHYAQCKALQLSKRTGSIRRPKTPVFGKYEDGRFVRAQTIHLRYPRVDNDGVKQSKKCSKRSFFVRRDVMPRRYRVLMKNGNERSFVSQESISIVIVDRNVVSTVKQMYGHEQVARLNNRC